MLMLCAALVAVTAYFCIVEMVIAIALRAHPTYTDRSGETYVAAMAMSVAFVLTGSATVEVAFAQFSSTTIWWTA